MWPPVKESPGDGEQRPVLLGLRDGGRGLQQPRSGGRARQRRLLRVHSLLYLLCLLRQTWTIKVKLFAVKKKLFTVKFLSAHCKNFSKVQKLNLNSLLASKKTRKIVFSKWKIRCKQKVRQFNNSAKTFKNFFCSAKSHLKK